MLPIELDPRLAKLSAPDLAALMIAVSDARQVDSQATNGEVTVGGQTYQWHIGIPTTTDTEDEPQPEQVLHIAAVPVGAVPIPTSLLAPEPT